MVGGCQARGCTCGADAYDRVVKSMRRKNARLRAMRALANLMYWAALEGEAEDELRADYYFSDDPTDRSAEADMGWALKARADALGGAMLAATYPTGYPLPPGLEWRS